MGDFDDSQHPRDEAGKFTEGGSAGHVAAATSKGDQRGVQAAHNAAAAKAKDPIERGHHQALAGRAAGKAAAAEGAKSGLASFRDKHAPEEGGSKEAARDEHAKEPAGEHGGGKHDDGHEKPGEGHGAGGAKHEEGHGLGAWAAHHLNEAKEGLEHNAEKFHEVEEKAIEGDPFQAAGAVAGAAGKVAVSPGGLVGKAGEKLQGGGHGEHGGKSEGGGHHG